MVLSPNVKPTYTLVPSRISWHSTPCSTQSPFALQTSGIPNHVVWATNSSYTKPGAHTQPITCNTIPQKDTTIPYMAQSRYPLNSQVLASFFPFATIPATPHHQAFTDRYSPQYGLLAFLLHFMTNTFFLTFLPLSPPPLRFHLISQSHSWSSPVYATIPDPSDKNPLIPPPSSLSHSPDLSCVEAQTIMFLGRFLV